MKDENNQRIIEEECRVLLLLKNEMFTIDRRAMKNRGTENSLLR